MRFGAYRSRAIAVSVVQLTAAFELGNRYKASTRGVNASDSIESSLPVTSQNIPVSLGLSLSQAVALASHWLPAWLWRSASRSLGKPGRSLWLSGQAGTGTSLDVISPQGHTRIEFTALVRVHARDMDMHTMPDSFFACMGALRQCSSENVSLLH